MILLLIPILLKFFYFSERNLVNNIINMSKIALITGATSGIGKATAKLLAANGYDVIITGRRMNLLNELAENIQKETGADVLKLNFDVRSLEQVEKAFESLQGKWVKIDVLINNAGLAVGLGPIHSGDNRRLGQDDRYKCERITLCNTKSHTGYG